MKRTLSGLLFLFLLSLASPAARGEGLHLSDYFDIYGLSRKEESAETPVPVTSMLPTAIPALPLRPMIAIVIDDAGVDVKRSARAVNKLNAPVTISYLAYARNIQEQVDSAAAQGHEVMLHLPWEPDSEKAYPGPNHLSVNMSSEKIQKNLEANLNGFTGYTGVNNHMGSRFSRHRAGLEVVMAELKKRDMFFLDSKTTPDSVAEKVAREYGVPASHRDVFLDHDENSRKVKTSLQEVEDIARRKGSVIAIGHPKDVTLNALEPWLSTIEAKGFQLVPLSKVVRYRQARTEAQVAAAEKK